MGPLGVDLLGRLSLLTRRGSDRDHNGLQEKQPAGSPYPLRISARGCRIYASENCPTD